MRIGLVGLGKMGANLALNMMDHGHDVVGFDASAPARSHANELGIRVMDSMADLVGALGETPRVLWLMVPSGEATDACVGEALSLLSAGDVLMDGGNTHWRRSCEHAAAAARRGVRYLDVGTSGGTSGAREGACLMVGGDEDAYLLVEGLLRDIAVEGGLVHTGPAGSGHFVKMVHNGIEYGMMQAMGEGFALLDASDFDLDLAAVADVWDHGSVIRGWLVQIMAEQLHKNPGLEGVAPVVDANGEAKWTVEAALDLEVPVPTIALSLMARNATKDESSFSARSVAVMRNGFGGHEVHHTQG